MIKVVSFIYDVSAYVALVDVTRCNWSQISANMDALMDLTASQLYAQGVVILAAEGYAAIRDSIVQYCTHGKVFELSSYYQILQCLFDSLGNDGTVVISPTDPQRPQTSSEFYPAYSEGISPSIGYINYLPESTTVKNDCDPGTDPNMDI